MLARSHRCVKDALGVFSPVAIELCSCFRGRLKPALTTSKNPVTDSTCTRVLPSGRISITVEVTLGGGRKEPGATSNNIETSAYSCTATDKRLFCPAGAHILSAISRCTIATILSGGFAASMKLRMMGDAA